MSDKRIQFGKQNKTSVAKSLIRINEVEFLAEHVQPMPGKCLVKFITPAEDIATGKVLMPSNEDAQTKDDFFRQMVFGIVKHAGMPYDYQTSSRTPMKVGDVIQFSKADMIPVNTHDKEGLFGIVPYESIIMIIGSEHAKFTTTEQEVNVHSN